MQEATIAAVSTPLGTGGIGIIRISGSRALDIADRVFRPSFSGNKLACAKGYTGMLGRIYNSGDDIDEAVAFVYRAPKSYTGEDVVELCCHGGTWAVQAVLRACLDNGAQSAQPGEFTKRAFLNGKLSLLEAESVKNLINAQDGAAMKAALAARDGALSTEIDKIVENLLEQSAHLGAWVDYPDEDIEDIESGSFSTALQQSVEKIDALLETWERGLILREGVDTVIVGRPNVGKSTLMNLLSGQQRSIVTDIPGTTRDIVEDSVRLGDCILRLSDTAGIRNTDDPVESIGVEMARNRMEKAGLVIAVFDSSDELRQEDLQLLSMLRDKQSIAVINKVDLPAKLDISAVSDAVGRVVELSAKSGSGREQLEKVVSEVLNMQQIDTSAPMVYSERQRMGLNSAKDSLIEAVQALEDGITYDAVGVLLDEALDSLLVLTGRKASEAVVDAVFAQFCVGK